jgi:PAS domain S-box-containing protein
MSDTRIAPDAVAAPFTATSVTTPAVASVLLVDDQPARLLTYEAVLSGLHIRCVRAHSGREALKQLLLQEFAVIVLDVSMPEMDGFETARLIREHPRLERMPIIFATGINVTEFDQLKGYEVGAIDYISVPVVPEILRSKIAVLVELYQRRSALEAMNASLSEARARLEAQHVSALAQSESQLMAIFEHPSQVNAVLEAVRDSSGAIVDWCFRDANRSSIKLMGRRREEIIGARITQVAPAERIPHVLPIYAEVLARDTVARYEISYGEQDFLITVFRMNDDCVISSGTDITERKRTEAALHESRERLLLAQTAARLGTHDWDIRKDIITWDERAYELWGLPLGTPITYEIFAKGLHPEDLGATAAAVERALDPQGDGEYSALYRVFNAIDTRTLWIEATGRVTFENGQPVRLVGTVQDVTECTLAQSQLRESEARFRELANNIDQFAWTCDAQGHTTWHNTRWFDYTGRSQDDLTGLDCSSLYHPEHVERVLSHWRHCLERGLPWEDTFPLRSRSGEYRWFLSRGVPIRDEHGNVLRWFGTSTDVTALRELQDELKQSDALKDEFLAMLSHELRNPTAAISNAAQVLSKLLSQTETEQSLVDIVQRQVTHLSRLLDDLLDVARITQGRIELKREHIPLQQCVQAAIEATESLIHEKGHRLSLVQSSPPLWVFADRVRLTQCVANLLNNAAKYMHAGGEIRVRTFCENGQVGVEVIDAGIGVSAELMLQIFDLFVQSKRPLDRSQGGLGIGLTVCRKLIEMQGGSVAGFSQGVGHGATFTLRLPHASGPARKLPTPQAAPCEQRVLIVDDNQDAADSLSLLLQLQGHETLTVYNGEAALAKVAEFCPALALLDIGLPDIDGYEVARRIKEIAPELKLIAVTGYGLVDDKLRSAAAGFDLHLVKPVALSDLEEAIATLRLGVR